MVTKFSEPKGFTGYVSVGREFKFDVDLNLADGYLANCLKKIILMDLVF